MYSVPGIRTYTFTYDNDGRISSVSLNGSTVGSYAYNGVEQRVAKTTSTTTHDVYDRFGHLMSEDDGSGNLIREYIWLDDLPIALVDNTGMSPVTYYIHTDQVGRPQKMTDGSANIVWDAVYDPFGNVSSLSGTATNLLMFPGQLYDSETALAQNWNREYDPTLGRYIQSDPLGLAAGANTFAYAFSNPTNAIDPTGLVIVVQGNANAVSSALNYLQADPGMKQIIHDLAASSATYTILAQRGLGPDQYNTATRTIEWDPNLAMRISFPVGGPCYPNTQSPALALGHELAHADAPWWAMFLSVPAEENRVVRGPETNAARTLNEGIRASHDDGAYFFVETPTSR